MKNIVLKFLFALALMMPFVNFAQTASVVTEKTTPVKKKLKKKGQKKAQKPANTEGVTSATATTSTASATPPPVNKTGGFPIMKFNSKFTNFGKVKTGDMPAITYDFVNTGDTPMDIEICSGCECTEIDWTRTTIQPGEKGFVKAVFNTVKAEKDDHKKQLTKYVDIILKQTHPSNGYPIVETVKFDVFIID